MSVDAPRLSAMADTFTVERATTIDAPAATVYPHVADFHAWTAWSPWEEVDPSMERSYTGADRGVGARYAWSGNKKAGRGSMEIVRADEPSRVEIDLQFEKPFKSRNDIVLALTETAAGQTHVTWTMIGPVTFMTRLMGLFMKMDKLVGGDFEKGLAKLKAVSEA